MVDLRDYLADVEAIMHAKCPTWKLEHFGLWADLVQVRTEASTLPSASTAEIMDMEDAAQQAKFREVRAKLAADVASMTMFHAQSAEAKRRGHVVKVMHERSQVQIGRELPGLFVC